MLRGNLHRMLRSSSLICCCFIVGIVVLVVSIGYPIDVSAKQDAEIKARDFQLDAVTENSIAPDFTLPDRSGIIHRLSDYKGRVVIINFWSTWCIPCRKEMPALERAWQRLKPSGAILLAIAMQDELESIEHFLKNSPVSFPVLLDSDGEIAKQWRVIGIPVTYILDTTGRIVYRATGIREWDSDVIINQILDLAHASGKRDK